MNSCDSIYIPQCFHNRIEAIIKSLSAKIVVSLVQLSNLYTMRHGDSLFSAQGFIFYTKLVQYNYSFAPVMVVDVQEVSAYNSARKHVCFKITIRGQCWIVLHSFHGSPVWASTGAPLRCSRSVRTSGWGALKMLKILENVDIL